MELIHDGLSFMLKRGGDTILSCAQEMPMIYVGCGKENVEMYRGNFKIG